jgi:hypothetical protein
VHLTAALEKPDEFFGAAKREVTHFFNPELDNNECHSSHRNKTEVLVDEFSYRHTEHPFRFRLPVQAGDTLDLCVSRGVLSEKPEIRTA